MSSMMKKLRAFHDDERGDDVLKNVMMLAVAALVVVGLIFLGRKLFFKTDTTVDEIINAKPFHKE